MTWKLPSCNLQLTLFDYELMTLIRYFAYLEESAIRTESFFPENKVWESTPTMKYQEVDQLSIFLKINQNLQFFFNLN